MPGQTVTIHYDAYLHVCNSWWLLCSFVVLTRICCHDIIQDGTCFDSSRKRGKTFEFMLGAEQVIKGVSWRQNRFLNAARVRWPVWCHFRLGDGNHAGGGKICLAFLFVFNMPFIDYTFSAFPLATYGDFTPIGHSWVKAIRPKSQSRRGWVGAPKDFLACEFACCYVSG